MEDWLLQLRRLKSVKRCATLRSNLVESVAEHSYYVALISLIIADKLIDRGWKVDKGELMLKALFHDAEESITGDIPHPVKYSTPEMYQVLETSKDKIMKEFFPPWITEINHAAKSGIEGEIVSIADYMELYLFCAEETLLGNKEFYWKEIMETCRRLTLGKEYAFGCKELWEEIFKEMDNYVRRGGLRDYNSRVVDGNAG